jgi:hypothetical protein
LQRSCEERIGGTPQISGQSSDLALAAAKYFEQEKAIFVKVDETTARKSVDFVRKATVALTL